MISVILCNIIFNVWSDGILCLDLLDFLMESGASPIVFFFLLHNCASIHFLHLFYCFLLRLIEFILFPANLHLSFSNLYLHIVFFCVNIIKELRIKEFLCRRTFFFFVQAL